MWYTVQYPRSFCEYRGDGKDVTIMEDSRILDLFFERSEQAIDALDAKYGHAVKKTAGNILRDRLDVEECANDTYLAAWNAIPPRRPAPLGGYVCRIARNLAVSRLRAETAARRSAGFDAVLDELAEVIPAREDVEAEVEAKELAAAVDRFLGALPYDDRFIFTRRYWFADSVADIAEAIGARPTFVSQRLFRLRTKLRNLLQKEGLLV